jgi:hypothetical protein
MRNNLLTCLFWLCATVCFAQGESTGQVVLPDTIRYIESDSTSIADELDAVVRDNSKIILSWKITGSSAEFFTIERSNNNKEFEIIAVLKQLPANHKMEWIDEQPARGKNQYRIRCSLADGSLRYSKSVSVLVGGNIAFRFYPNPADNILIIRSEQPIDFAIVDGNGKVRISQQQVSGLQLINVSTLEKGVYVLRVFNRQSNVLMQDKLVKN